MSVDVDGERPLPRRLIGIVKGKALSNAGVGEEQVDRTHGLDCGVDHGHVAGLGGHIGAQPDGAVELSGDVLRSGQVGHDDRGTPGVEAAGQRLADTSSASGDQRRLAIEVHRRMVDGTILVACVRRDGFRGYREGQ